ncbi:AraC family transcriptional regulator [Niallia circulans]
MEESIRKELKMSIATYINNNEVDYKHLFSLYKICKEMIQQEMNISPIVRRAKSIIDHQYADSSLSLEKVAITLQVSPVYLSRLMKQELKVSFVQLLTTKRMKQAIYLLQSTDYPIITISQLVGYETQHYFSTAFKKIMGVSLINIAEILWRKQIIYSEGVEAMKKGLLFYEIRLNAARENRWEINCPYSQLFN